jgi:hypothetical protein
MNRKPEWICAALVFAALAGAAAVRAQEATATISGGAPAAEGLPASELEKLVAPIALYPDVLIAQILPASTFPTDIVMAARWLRTKPDPNEIVKRPWDVSVLALCNYPDVIFKLDEDFEWTNALGAAFLNQQDDVMKAIQTARELAQERELLKTTPQQTVVVEEETIRIVPTETNTVYVPQYAPQIVYVDDDDDDDDDDAWVGAAIGFGTGLALGSWLNMDCNWYGGCVAYCRPGYWGGWAHHGAVAWSDDWVAGVGPRGGFIAGEDRGIAVGPYRGAAWGPNGGAVWRRPAVATPLPAYTGRYAGYSGYGGNYGNRNISGNTINRNINNVNVDRGNRVSVGGDRTNLGGGNRTNIGGGDRATVAGGDRTTIGSGNRGNSDRGDRPAASGDRPGPAAGRPGERPSQLPANAGDRSVRDRPAVPSDRMATGSRDIRSGQRSSAYNSNQRPSQTSGYSQRGQQSRDVARPSQSQSRQRQSTPSPSPSPSRAQPSRSSSPSRQSAYSSGGGRQSSSYGSRGASSRGGGGRGGGGGRRR